MDAKIAELIAKPPVRILGNRVLVFQEPYNDKLQSGLYIPSDSKLCFQDEATVITISPAARDKSGWLMSDLLKPGDRIVFKRHPDAALHPDSREPDTMGLANLLRLKSDHILAVLEAS